MRFEKGHKAATRQRIIDVASAKFRKEGVAAVGIAGLMADAGLTHGGFYAHFGSKEDLVREAMEAALDSTRERMDRAASENGAGLEGLVRRYLRPAHRDTPEQGCAIASLAAEIARHDISTRTAFSERVSAFLSRIAAQLPSGLSEAARQTTAISILSVMLGALQLSRVVTDAKLSDEILNSGVEAALRIAQPPQ
jgi:TetR/AcrR family transcriptional repressor of nem operon